MYVFCNYMMNEIKANLKVGSVKLFYIFQSRYAYLNLTNIMNKYDYIILAFQTERDMSFKIKTKLNIQYKNIKIHHLFLLTIYVETIHRPKKHLQLLKINITFGPQINFS